MKISSVKCILLLLALILNPTESHAGNLETSKSPDEQINGEKVPTPDNPVELWSRDRTLGEVLQEVNERSGIQFRLPETLRTDPVLANIQGKDWKSATGKLVKEYDRIEVWSIDPKNSKVWLLKSNSKDPSPVQTDGSHALENKAKIEIAFFSEEEKDEQVSLLDILPQELLVEPALWVYLQSLGIPLPGEAYELFGSILKSPPSKMEIPPHLLNNPDLNDYLTSIGIKTDSGVHFSD